MNATQAAIRAGYSQRCAAEQDYENLRQPQIAAAITAGKARQLASAELSAMRVLEELRRLAFVDLRGFFNDRGELKPMHELTEEQGAQLAEYEVIIKSARVGDGPTKQIHKIKVWDKPQALEMLAKHFKLLIDRVEVEPSDENISRLLAGRRRAAQVAAEIKRY